MAMALDLNARTTGAGVFVATYGLCVVKVVASFDFIIELGQPSRCSRCATGVASFYAQATCEAVISPARENRIGKSRSCASHPAPWRRTLRFEDIAVRGIPRYICTMSLFENVWDVCRVRRVCPSVVRECRRTRAFPSSHAYVHWSRCLLSGIM